MKPQIPLVKSKLVMIRFKMPDYEKLEKEAQLRKLPLATYLRQKLLIKPIRF